MFKSLRKFGILIATVAILTACNQSSNKNQSTISSDTFSIIGGSELKILEPVVKDAQEKLGFPINIKYSGTIEGVDAVKSGANYDAAWFGNAKYFYDSPESSKRIKLSEKIMFSPVIVGVKESSFTKNNLKTDGIYTWKDIASWVKDKKMTYAMTDPSVSNTGYVALMGVVYATANKGENIKLVDVNQSVLKDFFKGQKVTAKSSNWIMDVFNNDASIDFVVNYESAILNNPSKLIPVYPSEGIVTSDYPILLLNSEKTEQYKKLVAYLKSNEIQSKLVNDYKIRSISSDVMTNQKVFDQSKLLVEMPFNPDTSLSDSILSSYFNDYKKPAKFAFVIDTSGSMGGDREKLLKDSMNQLITDKLSKYANIRNRESVFVIPFSSQPYDLKTFDSNQKQQLNSYIQNLKMDGGTAMYDAVAQALVELKKDKDINHDEFRYSVIVLTDGMTNQGASFQQFQEWFIQKGFDKQDMRVFAISFGDADINQLNSLTQLTKGSVFDGKTSLGAAFKEIRTYQ
jgi:Ca-activated chloride channel family protein